MQLNKLQTGIVRASVTFLLFYIVDDTLHKLVKWLVGLCFICALEVGVNVKKGCVYLPMFLVRGIGF